jgi:hypothetical protein
MEKSLRRDFHWAEIHSFQNSTQVLPSIYPDSPNDSFKLQWISRDRNHSFRTKVGFTARSLVSYGQGRTFGFFQVLIARPGNGRMFRFLSELQGCGRWVKRKRSRVGDGLWA